MNSRPCWSSLSSTAVLSSSPVTSTFTSTTRMMSTQSVDELQDPYDSTLCALIDKHAPSRKARYRHQPMTPWFDSRLLKSKTEDKSFRAAILKIKAGLDYKSEEEAAAVHKQSLFWRGRFQKAWEIQRNYGGICRP